MRRSPTWTKAADKLRKEGRPRPAGGNVDGSGPPSTVHALPPVRLETPRLHGSGPRLPIPVLMQRPCDRVQSARPLWGPL